MFMYVHVMYVVSNLRVEYSIESMLHLIIDAGCICTKPLLSKVLTFTYLPDTRVSFHRFRVSFHISHFTASQYHFTSLHFGTWSTAHLSLLGLLRYPYMRIPIPICIMYSDRYDIFGRASLRYQTFFLPPDFWRPHNSM